MSRITRTSSHPIGQLLLTALHSSGLSPAVFIERLGYGNLTSGLRAYDEWLLSGRGKASLLERVLLSAWSPGRDAVEAALAQTELQLRAAGEQRARTSFHPFVQARTERSRPSQISLYGITGGPARYTTLLPDEVSGWPQAEQDAIVKETACELYARLNGTTFFMGAITGFLYFSAYGEPPIYYTTEGEPVCQVDAAPAGSAWGTVG